MKDSNDELTFYKPSKKELKKMQKKMEKRQYEEIENSFYPSTDEGKRQWSDEALEWSNSHPNVGKKAYKKAKRKMRKQIRKYITEREKLSKSVKEFYLLEQHMGIKISKRNK